MKAPDGSTRRPQLRVFAKAPVAGLVKTRLARTIGDEAACEVYRELLGRTLRRLDGAGPWRAVIAATPDAAADRPYLWPTATARARQGPGDLGARMLRFLSAAAPGAPVVIVGADIPDIEAAHVAQAFAALERSDLVFGPAVDGGYWLIGAGAPPPEGLFDGVRWSSAEALADTLANCSGLRVAQLDIRLEDVDDAESYRRFRAREAGQP